MIAALKAGKDVYVEKPMSIELAGANEALDLARANKRVVQAGTQYRSNGGYRATSKVLATGILGHISRVTAEANFNHARWARGYGDCKEADVDWDAYLLDLPKRPFDARLLRRWHLYRECTNGLSGLWMSHYVDAVHLMTGATYPRSAVAHGDTFVWKDGREHSDTFHALIEYPEGFLFSWGMGLANAAGTRFTVHGTRGTLDVGTNHVDPNRLIISADGGTGEPKLETQKIQREPGESHMANWIECIRSRERPNADIAFGHQHAVATILAAEALHTGKRQIYDPEKREIRAG
jgi:predicted dehydrogenase